jgi:hypothetical protein
MTEIWQSHPRNYPPQPSLLRILFSAPYRQRDPPTINNLFSDIRTGLIRPGARAIGMGMKLREIGRGYIEPQS